MSIQRYDDRGFRSSDGLYVLFTDCEAEVARLTSRIQELELKETHLCLDSKYNISKSELEQKLAVAVAELEKAQNGRCKDCWMDHKSAINEAKIKGEG
jgi:hypothetical protein